MSFVYVLIFVMRSNGGEGLVALELKTYDTFEACKTAAEMTETERRSKYYPNGKTGKRERVVAGGIYECLVRPF